MKAVESRNAASTIRRANTPFFSKESDQHFFGSTQNEKPFFPSSKRPASSIQAKLNIGQPNDHYEVEADSMADKVVQRIADPSVQTKSYTGEFTPFFQKKSDSLQKEDKIQEHEEDPKETKQKLHLKPIFESNGENPEDGNIIYRKYGYYNKGNTLWKKTDVRVPEVAGPDIESRLTGAKNSGHALPEKTRQQMESSMGADFSQVRIHDDSDAAQLSGDLNAQAFTHDNDIYFNSGKYDTGSSSGQYLLAHELTHVIQQNGGDIKNKKQADHFSGDYLKADKSQVQRFDIPFTDYETDFSVEGLKTAAGLTADTVKAGATWVKDKVESGLKWIVDEIRDLVNSGIAWLKEKFEEIKKFSLDVYDQIKSTLGSALDMITFPIKIITNALGIMDADMLSSAWSALTAGVSFLWNTVKMVVNGILSIGTGIWSTVSGFVNTLFNSVDSLMNNRLFNLLPDLLKDNARSLFNSVRSFWKSIRDFWDKFWEKLTRFVHDLMKSIEKFLQKIINYAIHGLIAIVKTLKEVRDFIQLVTSDPEAVIRPIIAQVAGKIEKEAPGKANEVKQEKMSEALSKVNGSTSVSGKIQRAPAGTMARRTAGRDEVNNALNATFAEQWKALDIKKMLWDTIVNMFWPPATIRAIGHEFYELWNTDWANAVDSLFMPRNILDDFSGFFHDIWSNILILLDFPLALWRRLNNILMLLLGYVTIILIIVGAVGGAIAGGGALSFPGAIAGAIAGLKLAAALGAVLLASFIAAEGISALKAFLDLYTARQTQKEKDRDYLQIVGSVIGIGIALVIYLIFLLFSYLVSSVVALIKGKTPAQIPAKTGKIEPLEDQPGEKNTPKEDVKDSVKTDPFEAIRASVKLKIGQIQERLGRINNQVSEVPKESDSIELRKRVNSAQEKISNLEKDLQDAGSKEEIDLIDGELDDFNRDVVDPLQIDTNKANIPLATPAEQPLIDQYTDALRRLREAQDKIDGGASGEDLNKANEQKAGANTQMETIEKQATDAHNDPKSDISRLKDQIDSLTLRRKVINEGGADPAIGKSFPQSEAVQAARRMPNQSPRGLRFEEIERAAGGEPRISGSSKGSDGAVRLEWQFPDGSRLHVDVPGPENTSPFEINRSPHAGLNAPSPSEVFPSSNKAFSMDERGTVVPDQSAPAHMPVVRDARLNFLLRGR